MKILFACGGTAGHINPALATAAVVRKHHPDAQIRFVGNPNGMEGRLIKRRATTFLRSSSRASTAPCPPRPARTT